MGKRRSDTLTKDDNLCNFHGVEAEVFSQPPQICPF